MSDSVNHPAHYGGEDNPYETIKIMEATAPSAEFRGFLKLNALKYQFRADRKNGAEDYRKAIWYLERLVEHDGQNGEV